MSESNKKQSFLYGTALLTMATAIVKIIGALYKIPLNAIIGKQGFSYFNTAYEIYAVLLMVSTAGLPVAMSRMISQANALGHHNQVRRIYKTSRSIFLILGISGSFLMTVFCRQLAGFLNQPDAWAAIATLGPCVLLICIMSTFRGFFQGQSNMLPTSISQIIEAVVKLVVGITAALILLKATQSIPLAASGAILGVTASCLVSSLYLYSKFRRAYEELPVSSEEPRTYATTAKNLLNIAIPITLGGAGLQILTMLETKIYMGQLLNLGYTQLDADNMKGIYNMAQTIFNMPCAFITPIAISIIPAITSHLTLLDHKGAKSTQESAVRVTGLISMPCGLGLIALAQPVTALLGGYGGEDLILSTRLMTILGVCVLFNAIVLLTNAMLQAHGYATTSVLNMMVGGVVNLVVAFILTGNPVLNILGAPIGTVTCYLSISILNLMSLRRRVNSAPAILRNLIKPLMAAVIMGLCAYGSWYGLRCLGVGSRLLLCALPVLVGVVVYGVAAVVLKVITKEDCMLLPKGEKIAKLLHL